MFGSSEVCCRKSSVLQTTENLLTRSPHPLLLSWWLCMGGLTMYGGWKDWSVSSFHHREPLLTQHRVGWRPAQWCCWAFSPNIDVILLISTLSLLLINLISAWCAGEQQQTNRALFLSHHTDFHMHREKPSLLFFSSLLPESLNPSAHGLSIRSHINTAEILKSWPAQSHRMTRSFFSLLPELVLQESNH